MQLVIKHIIAYSYILMNLWPTHDKQNKFLKNYTGRYGLELCFRKFQNFIESNVS